MPQPECSGHTHTHTHTQTQTTPKNKARKVSAVSQKEVRRKYILLHRLLTENSVLWNQDLIIKIGAAMVSEFFCSFQVYPKSPIMSAQGSDHHARTTACPQHPMYSTCVEYSSASHKQESLVSVTTYQVCKLIILSARLIEHWLWDLSETGTWFLPQGLRKQSFLLSSPSKIMNV